MTQDDCWAAKYNEVMEENLSLAVISQKDFKQCVANCLILSTHMNGESPHVLIIRRSAACYAFTTRDSPSYAATVRLEF